MGWIDYVKQVQLQNNCSYKDALKLASQSYKKGGAIWNLTPDEKKKYIADKNNPAHTINKGSYTIWDKNSY
jgi:hypothetical protein